MAVGLTGCSAPLKLCCAVQSANFFPDTIQCNNLVTDAFSVTIFIPRQFSVTSFFLRPFGLMTIFHVAVWCECDRAFPETLYLFI